MKYIFVKIQFCGRYVLSRRIRKQMVKQTLEKSGKPHIFMYISQSIEVHLKLGIPLKRPLRAPSRNQRLLIPIQDPKKEV